VHRQVVLVDTVVVDIPVVRTSAGDTAASGMTAVLRTGVVVGTVAVEDKRRAAAVAVEDNRLLVVEDKCAGAGENQTVVDKASEPGRDIRRCMEAVDLKL